MSSQPTLPEYINVAENERGTSLGMDFDSYRHLARVALAIIRQEDWTMGIYRRPEEGCGLDIFTEMICLSILVTVSKEVISIHLSNGFCFRECRLPSTSGEFRENLAQTPETGQRGDPRNMSFPSIQFWVASGTRWVRTFRSASFRQTFASMLCTPPAPRAKEDPRHLNFNLNQPYRLDGEGYLRGQSFRTSSADGGGGLGRGAIADELAEGEVSETLAAAMEVAREEMQAEVEVAKANLRVKAEQADEIKDSLREEQDAQIERGDYDQFDSIPEELSRTGQDDSTEDATASSPEAVDSVKVSAKRKPGLKAKKKSYVRRGNKFLSASRVELIEGEKLYWLRKRKFGQAEKYIPFGKVERKANV